MIIPVLDETLKVQYLNTIYLSSLIIDCVVLPSKEKQTELLPFKLLLVKLRGVDKAKIERYRHCLKGVTKHKIDEVIDVHSRRSIK